EAHQENAKSVQTEASEQSPKNWDESEVSTWLKSIGVKKQYIEKLYEEEVDGQILLALNEDFLKTKICMKAGPALLIIQKRDELLNSLEKPLEKKNMHATVCGHHDSLR
uniref:SAM domain-containing protein n=1 Tax=Anabas testudineus TaxID=64144 RepID=A0A7N6F693_ANATE